MTHSFRFVALPAEPFASLFRLSEAELRSRAIRRVVVDEKPGYPCRVSLADAEIGETVLLLPFEHHGADSAYRASGPIFVRRDVATARPGVGEVPTMFRHRLLSVRAYDEGAMMVGAEVGTGDELEGVVERLFKQAAVSYLHIHNAGPGCYNCSVVRA
jgi:hypothetical protein